MTKDLPGDLTENIVLLTLPYFFPQALFARKWMLRVKLFDNRCFLLYILQEKFSVSKKIPKKFSIRLALFVDNLGEFPSPNRVTCG